MNKFYEQYLKVRDKVITQNTEADKGKIDKDIYIKEAVSKILEEFENKLLKALTSPWNGLFYIKFQKPRSKILLSFETDFKEKLQKELLNLIPDFLILLSFKTIDDTQYYPNGYYLITLKPKEFT